MPRISGTPSQQIRISKSEIKGRDYFTLKGKSQHLYLEETPVDAAKNVANLPSSFHQKTLTSAKNSAFKTACFPTALSLGLLASLSTPLAAASDSKNVTIRPLDRSKKNRDRLTSIPLPQSLPDCMQKPTSQPSRFSKKSAGASGVFPTSIFHAPTSTRSPCFNNVHKTRQVPTPNSGRQEALNQDSVPPIYGRENTRRELQRRRTKRQQQEREAKTSRNQGDERYWSPLDETPVPIVSAEISEQTRNVTPSDEGQRWEIPLKKVMLYLQRTPPERYSSLAANRLDTAIFSPRQPDQNESPAHSDEERLDSANALLDPTAANYSFTVAERFMRAEILLYYVKSRTLDWDLDATSEAFEADFLEAHRQHHAQPIPEAAVTFYAAQFKKPQRKPADPFLTREQAGGLTAYYAQFTDYLTHHAADDAATLVRKTVNLQHISPLDLERPYVALFSLRVGEVESELLPHSASKTEKYCYGPIIYILKGDSGKIYAASLWGAALVVAEASALFTPEVIEPISALKNGKLIASTTLASRAMVATLWPTFVDNVAIKTPIMARFDHQIEFNNTTPTLTDCLDRIQHQAINRYVDAWRDSNLNKTTLENILSLVPFFGVIQRKLHDPQYQPTFKELAFDLLDLGITLLTLGIPIVKLGLNGVKIGLLALKAGRAAGLVGMMLRSFVMKALQPTLSKIAKITAREIAAFIVPPVDLVRLLRKPVRTAARKMYKTAAHRVRCRRAIGGACLPFTHSVNGFDVNEWEKLLTKLVTTPVTWHGTIFNRQYRHNYIRAFNTLSVDQQRAIRDWSFIPKQKRYNNYPRKNSSPEGMGNINFELNAELVKTYPDAAMLRRAGNLRNALRLLPDLPTRQRLIRIVDIPLENILRFRAGDIVSNYPTFMSASAEGRLLNIALFRGALFNPQWINNPDSVIAVYIISGKRAKPLMLRVASQVKLESEYMFEQKSFFRVEAVTSLWQTNPGRSPKEVYFIKLEEIPYHRILNVKNIYTGGKVSF